MVGKRKIQEDEILAEEVRKYPCLYDKSDSGYKERDRVKNAWKAVENELGLEEGLYCYIIICSSIGIQHLSFPYAKIW